MKKYLLVFMMMSLALTVGAHDIEVKNADDVTIYYNYINEGTELEVTFRGESYDVYYEYSGNVVIPEEVNYMNRIRKVTSIGESAFWHCSITSVTIPNSVTSIGRYAFEWCSRLTSVTIGNSVTSIGDHAFYNCNRMTSVSIGNSVTSIGNDAFLKCKGLTSVTIPNSVTSIGDYAFDCKNLATVVSLIENPLTITWYTSNPVAGHIAIAFSQNTFMNGTLYVPKGTKFAYEAKEGWKDFRNIVEGTPTGITRVTSDKETPNAPIYDLNGRRLTEPQKGINIIEGKKVLIK